MSRRWYIVGTYSGYENSVKQDLERRMETMNMKDKIYQVIVPEESEEVTTLSIFESVSAGLYT